MIELNRRAWVTMSVSFQMVAIAWIGSFGRLVADEYCMCRTLMEFNFNPMASALSTYTSWSGEYTAHLLQATLSHLPSLLLGQPFASSLTLVLLWLSLGLFIQVASSLFWNRSSISAHFSFFLSFLVVIGLLLPGSLGISGYFEVLTQQAFLSNLGLRYFGFAAVTSGFLVITFLALSLIQRQRSGKGGLLQLLALSCIGFLAGGLPYVLVALFLLLVIATMISTDRVIKARELTKLFFVVATTLVGAIVSLSSPGAAERRVALREATQQRTLEQQLFSAFADSFWIASSVFSISFIFVVFSVITVIACRSTPSGEDLGRIAWWRLGLVIGGLVGAQVFASANSYSAAWHPFAPRVFVLALSALASLAIASRIASARKKSTTHLLALFALPAIVAGGTIQTFLWASEIPNDWESFHLPIQPNPTGPGEIFVLQDTEYALWAECYRDISHLLRHKKSPDLFGAGKD